MKCFFCQGLINPQEDRCINGHSTDINYVLMVRKKQAAHTINLRTTWRDGALRRRLKKREEQGVKARLNRKIKVEFPK